MSLDWNVENVENPPHLDQSLPRYEREDWSVILKEIIWATLSCRMGGYKNEREALEFYRRYIKLAIIYNGDVVLSWNDVKTYIGIHTNVDNETPTAWNRRIKERHGW